MGLIETIRSKPDHIKSRYALLGALLVTLIIAGVWFSVLPARFALIEEHLKDGALPKTDALSARIENTFDTIVETPEEPSLDSAATDKVTPEGALGALSVSGNAASLGVVTRSPEQGESPVERSPVVNPEDSPLPPTITPSTSTARSPTSSGYILIGTTTKKTQ